MNVSYGPPGQKGVTTLMAVGADDLEQTTTDRAVSRASWLAAGAWLFGALTGQRTVKHIGMGATIALVGVRFAAGTLGAKRIAVSTAPVPVAPAAGW